MPKHYLMMCLGEIYLFVRGFGGFFWNKPLNRLNFSSFSMFFSQFWTFPLILDYFPAAHNNNAQTTTNNIDNNYYENYDEYYESYEQQQQQEGDNSGYRGRREEKLTKRTRTYFCDICSIQCVGEQAYQSHLDGKNHKKKLNSAQGTSAAVAQAKNKPAYHCEICNVDCTGADSYKTHINGQKHQKVLMIKIQ